jgi:sugar phosphate isomerase/epimerase
MMRVGLLSTSTGTVDLDAAFALAHQAAAEGVEVVYGGEKGPQALDHWSAEAQRLTALAKQHHVALAGLNLALLCDHPSLVTPGRRTARSQQIVHDALTVASAAQAGVVLIPFFGHNAIETQDHLNRAAAALADLVDGAEEAGVVLGIESTLNFDQQQFLLDHLGNSPFAKVYYDTGDALARKLDAPTGIRELGRERIVQVHLKDVRIAEGRPPDFAVALGEGNMDFRAVAQALRAVGFDGWVILETPPGNDPAESARRNISFARQLLGET